MARPVDWSSTTIAVLRAAGSTSTCAFAIHALWKNVPQDYPRAKPMSS
jgi:hypothetical protein